MEIFELCTCACGVTFALFIPLDITMLLLFSIFVSEVGSVWYRSLYEISGFFLSPILSGLLLACYSLFSFL